MDYSSQVKTIIYKPVFKLHQENLPLVSQTVREQPVVYEAIAYIIVKFKVLTDQTIDLLFKFRFSVHDAITDFYDYIGLYNFETATGS